MGLPAMSASGLPGKRDESQRAGMTAKTRLLRLRPRRRSSASAQALMAVQRPRRTRGWLCHVTCQVTGVAALLTTSLFPALLDDATHVHAPCF